MAAGAEKPAKYDGVAQALHWVMALGILGMYGLAFYMDELPIGPRKVEMYNLHKSGGLLLLLLAAVRLYWRWRRPAPPLPETMPRWERRAADASHHLLYLLIFAQPLAGLVMAWASEFPTTIFGLFNLPSPTGPVPWLKDAALALHGAIGWLLLLTVCLHVLAALRHRLLLKDEVLARMLPGGEK